MNERMIPKFSILVTTIFIFNNIFAQGDNTGHKLNLITNYPDSTIFLGSYYGKKLIVIDSVKADNKGVAVFEGNTKLPLGIYFAVSPDKHIKLFEFLVDDIQYFTIKENPAKPGVIQSEGSPDNELFSAYTDFVNDASVKINNLKESLKTAPTKEDSTRININLKAEGNKIFEYRNHVLADKPNSLLSRLLQIAQIPEAPPMPTLANGTKDTLYPFFYVKNNYWNGVEFYNDLCLRTPFFEPKLDDYFQYYVSPNPDSVISEVNYILLSARASDDMFRYLLGKFTDKYINPTYMGQDKVFLFLFENFFARGDTGWLSDKQKKYIFDRGYSLMANQLGDFAPQLNVNDTLGNAVSLYKIKAPFTFVAFWDPHCSHCQLQVPRVDSFYEAKWKKEGVAVLAVCVNTDVLPDWKKFIIEKKLNGWIHAYEPDEVTEALEKSGQATYHQLFDIQQTPTFYLLDADKRIIAKSLSIDQFDALLDNKIKSQATTSNQ
jgi:peroxiredoxin